MRTLPQLTYLGAVTAVVLSFAAHQTIAQERTNGGLATRQANRFLTRVRLLSDEARRFELDGDLNAAYELATRADSILATVFRTSNAKWPENEETPAELIARLRFKARKIQSAKDAQRVSSQQPPTQASSGNQVNQARAGVRPASRIQPRPTFGQQTQPNALVAKPAVSKKPDASDKIAEEPRLLLEQLDRAETTWQSFDEPKSTVEKSTNTKPIETPKQHSDSVDVNPFANRAPVDAESNVKPLGNQSSQPFLLMPRDAGNQLKDTQTVATIPTEAAGSIETPNGKRPWNHSSLNKESDASDNVFLSEFPSEPAQESASKSVPPPFELEVAESKRLEKISPKISESENENTEVARLESNAISKFSVPKSDGKLNATQNTEHAHTEDVIMWVLAGVVLTLIGFWTCRVLLQFLFGVRMTISFHGRAKVIVSSAGLSQAANEVQEEETADSNTDAPIAVNNASLTAFPFRLVGGSDEENQSETSADDSAESKQKLQRNAVKENLSLQANDRRDAA